jgi:hypothetical protein
MQSFPVITYPFSWEPPKYHLGMELYFRDELHICIGMDYQTTQGLEGWWYHYREGEGSVGCHESEVWAVPNICIRQLVTH